MSFKLGIGVPAATKMKPDDPGPSIDQRAVTTPTPAGESAPQGSEGLTTPDSGTTAEWSGIMRAVTPEYVVGLAKELAECKAQLARQEAARERLTQEMKEIPEPMTRKGLVHILEAYNDYVVDSAPEIPGEENWMSMGPEALAIMRLCSGLRDLDRGSVDPLLLRGKSFGRATKLSWERQAELEIAAWCEGFRRTRPSMTRTMILKAVSRKFSREPLSHGRAYSPDQVDRCWKAHRKSIRQEKSGSVPAH
jgi:hypothetical protein